MTQTPIAPVSEPAPVLSLTRVGLRQAQARGVVVLDTRDADRYAVGHWPGSVNIPLDGPFALNAALAFCGDSEIALVSDPGTETEARDQLVRAGLARIAGVLAGGLGPLDAGRLVSLRRAHSTQNAQTA